MNAKYDLYPATRTMFGNVSVRTTYLVSRTTDCFIRPFFRERKERGLWFVQNVPVNSKRIDNRKQLWNLRPCTSSHARRVLRQMNSFLQNKRFHTTMNGALGYMYYCLPFPYVRNRHKVGKCRVKINFQSSARPLGHRTICIRCSFPGSVLHLLLLQPPKTSSSTKEDVLWSFGGVRKCDFIRIFLL